MPTATVSSKYQVVIPKSVRTKLGIRPGEKMQVFLYDGRIEYAPVKSLRSLRGFLPGLETAVEREEGRRPEAIGRSRILLRATPDP